MRELFELIIKRSVSKKLILLLVLASIFLNIGVARGAEAARGYTIMVKDAKLPTDEGFEFRDLALFMPLDDSVTIALDAVVQPVVCDGECFKVVTYDGVVTFKVGSTEMVTEDGKIIESQSAYKIGSIYYIPAESYFSALGFETKMDEKIRTLFVDYEITDTTARERLAEVLNLKLKKTEEIVEVPVGEPAGYEPSHKIDYTFENTTKMNAVRVVGNKLMSSREEKGDYYNQFNIRFMGLLANGYDFNSSLKTNQTTQPKLKKGELKKLEMSWEKNKIRVAAYDLQPKMNLRYALRNYNMQGVSYKRSNDNYKWYAAAGKTPKRTRQSKYARYVSTARVEKPLSKKRKMNIGMTHIFVRDTGEIRGLKKLQNQVTVMDFKSNVGRSYVFQAEVANSYIRRLATWDSMRDTAFLYNLDYRGRKVTMKSSYEKTGNEFYSETSSFTRGRTELSTLYNIKTGPDTVFGQGMKHKRIKDRTTKVYPTSFTTRPIGSRNNFKMTAKRNFEKTTGSSSRILDTRELQVTDKVGVARVTAKGTRQKNKIPGKQIAYRDQKSISIKSPLTEKMGVQLDLKEEQWSQDRTSIARQNKIKIDFEPKEWSEIAVDVSRYYNTPSNARTTTRMTYQKINIINDSEWKMEFKFENYRDYNIKSLEISYGFFR